MVPVGISSPWLSVVHLTEGPGRVPPHNHHSDSIDALPAHHGLPAPCSRPHGCLRRLNIWRGVPGKSGARGCCFKSDLRTSLKLVRCCRQVQTTTWMSPSSHLSARMVLHAQAPIHASFQLDVAVNVSCSTMSVRSRFRGSTAARGRASARAAGGTERQRGRD